MEEYPGLTLHELAVEGNFNEDGGTLGDQDWEDALVLSSLPPDDPVAYAEDCEAMGK